jgi:hypothetical protein
MTTGEGQGEVPENLTTAQRQNRDGDDGEPTATLSAGHGAANGGAHQQQEG